MGESPPQEQWCCQLEVPGAKAAPRVGTGAGGGGQGTHMVLELLGKTRRGFRRLLEADVSSLAWVSGWEEEEAGDYVMRAEQPR